MRGAIAKRRDDNEPEIVSCLRAVGASVSRLGDHGVPDLLVGYRGRTFLLEVKMPLNSAGGTRQKREHEGGRGDLTRAQVKWWGEWRGEPATVVRCAADALAAIGLSKEAT